MSVQTEKRPHLSPSQITMYLRCGEQYRRRYMEGETLPPGVAMLSGKSCHKAIEGNFRQKIETHEDLPRDDFADLAAAAFDEEAAGDIGFNEEEASRGSKIVLGEAKDKTVGAATFHGERQAPDYQPAIVEEWVRIPLPSADRDLLGVIDLADDQGRVTDFKVTGRRKQQSEADSSLQLTTYAAAYQRRTGEPPAEVRLDAIVQQRTKTDRQVLSSARSEGDFISLAAVINSVLAGIRAGVFLPADPNAWWCDSRFCGYARTCPYYRKDR